tara:strand:- start:101 stop:952 length:852 start_codon:yes stop_codon:yes gene_type:complete
MIEIAFGFVAAICWGLHDFLVRFIVKKVNIISALFYTNLIGILFLAVFFFLSEQNIILNVTFIFISIIYGILFFIATYGLYRAFDGGPVFVAAPIICSYPILSLIYAAILTTSPKPHQWLLSLIVVFGIFLTVYTKKENMDKVKTVKLETIYWSILSAIFFSLSFQLGQNQIINSNEIISNLIARTSSIMVLVFLFANHIKFKSIKPNYIIILILMGIVDTLALLIMVYSGNFNHPEFSSVSASTFGLITILLVCFFYKEKLNFIQISGISLVFSSIAILTLS